LSIAKHLFLRVKISSHELAARAARFCEAIAIGIRAVFDQVASRKEQPPLTLPSPRERVEKGWRGAAEPYPELGEGVQSGRKLL
jgi:uncharacterized protein YceH (UPF0502 family)